jgi:hypothetical protein
VPIFFAGRRIGGTFVAATAASLWAIFPNAIVLPYEALWDSSLAALLAATILWATLWLDQSRRVKDWCLYGLLWGLALMTNAALASLLLLLVWIRSASRVLPALAAAVALLVCVPWTIRNYAAFHAFVPLRSVMGLSLYAGNNEGADGLTPSRHPISNSAERAKYIERGEIAYMSDKRSEGIRFMLLHPGAELRLIQNRFVAIWTGGTAHPITDFLRSRSLWFRWVVLFNVFAAIGAAAGIVVLFRQRSRYLFPLAIFPIVFPLPYYLTLAMPRYRHPIDPVLLLLIAIVLIYPHTRNSRFPETWSRDPRRCLSACR